MKAKQFLLTSFLLMFIAVFGRVSAESSIPVGNGTPQSCNEWTLREAIEQGGEITFNCGSQPHTIYLTREVRISADTDFNGNNLITLDGRNKNGILTSERHLTISLQNITLQNGRTWRQGGALELGYWNDLTVSNVTFLNNTATKQNAKCDGGGAIFIGGGSVAHIENSHFENNRAQNGGAINNLRSRLTVLNSSFHNNHAQHSAQINQFGDCGGGGAVYIDATRKPHDGGPDPIVLRGNTYTANTTNNHGGAVFVAVHAGDTVEISDSHFEDNRAMKAWSMASSGTGGAIWYGKAVGEAVNNRFALERSAFINNHADSQGGGVWTSLPMTVRNSTFFGNSAVNPAWLDKDDWRKGNGGGIAVAHQVLVILESSTIAGNRAGFNGGGVVGENIAARNTIIANNVGDWYLDLQQNCTHTLHNWGNNLQFLIGDDDSARRSNCGTIQHADPLLGSLQNGVLPLLPASPAVDAGSNRGCPPVDQRGVTRPQGRACDIGAFELSP